MAKLYRWILILLLAPMTLHSGPVASESAVLEIEKDTVLLRNDTQVYMVSEANRLIADVKHLGCFDMQLLLLSSLDISKQQLGQWPLLSYDPKQLKEQIAWVDKLVQIIKLMEFVQKAKSNLTQLIPESLQIKKGCLSEGKWSEQLTTLVATEFFLRERFERAKQPHPEKNKAKEAEKNQAKGRQASTKEGSQPDPQQDIKLFLDTVLRKYDHVYYF